MSGEPCVTYPNNASCLTSQRCVTVCLFFVVQQCYSLLLKGSLSVGVRRL